jgi:hypothetical protein
MRIKIPQVYTVGEVQTLSRAPTMVAISMDCKYFAQASTDPDDKSGFVAIYVCENGAYVLRHILKPIDSEPCDSFGMSICFSEDAKYLVVGSDYKASYIGAAYVFINSFFNWKQVAKLIPPDGNKGDQFGLSVVISKDSSTIAVGSPGAVGGYGAVYIYTVRKNQWAFDEKLIYSRMQSLSKRDLRELGTFLMISPDGRVVDGYCLDSKKENQYSAVRFISRDGAWFQWGDNVVSHVSKIS